MFERCGRGDGLTLTLAFMASADRQAPVERRYCAPACDLNQGACPVMGSAKEIESYARECVRLAQLKNAPCGNTSYATPMRIVQGKHETGPQATSTRPASRVANLSMPAMRPCHHCDGRGRTLIVVLLSVARCVDHQRRQHSLSSRALWTGPRSPQIRLSTGHDNKQRDAG